jgi:hypothetical protein
LRVKETMYLHTDPVRPIVPSLRGVPRPPLPRLAGALSRQDFKRIVAEMLG